MKYEELVKKLRYCGNAVSCIHCPYWEGCGGSKEDLAQAADAIEELLKAAKAMHTWIFLNSVDEQTAYDECGLTEQMNAVLGYGGQFVAEPPKEES